MSKEAPPLDDAEHIFIGANFVMANKETGKPVFSMKRKEPTRPDGTKELYYIFQFHEENMYEGDREKLQLAFHEFMAPLAAQMGIGLFSFDEISEKCGEAVKKLYEGGGEIKEEQIDLTIKVTNYATDTVDNLIVGVSTKPPDWKPEE